MKPIVYATALSPITRRLSRYLMNILSVVVPGTRVRSTSNTATTRAGGWRLGAESPCSGEARIEACGVRTESLGWEELSSVDVLGSCGSGMQCVPRSGSYICVRSLLLYA